jgi:hypothetical protein
VDGASNDKSNHKRKKTMKITVKDFRVSAGKKVNLKKWPTLVKPVYKTKTRYNKLLKEQVGGAELAATSSLRVQPLCGAADFSGDGRRRKGWRHPARDVRCQSTRLPGVQLQTPECYGAGPRFFVAHHPVFARTRPHRHLQPFLLRGSADRSGASGDLRSQALPDELLDEKTIWEERYRSIVNLENHLYRNGTRIIKFFLQLSKEEQRKRFLERIDEPDNVAKTEFPASSASLL